MQTTMKVIHGKVDEVLDKYLAGELMHRIRSEIVSAVMEGMNENEPNRLEAESNYHDCVNELCMKCGMYREEHNGACDGCRWLKPRRGW